MKKKWIKANVFFKKMGTSAIGNITDREVYMIDAGIFVRGKPNDLVTFWPWHIISEIDFEDFDGKLFV